MGLIQHYSPNLIESEDLSDTGANTVVTTDGDIFVNPMNITSFSFTSDGVNMRFEDGQNLLKGEDGYWHDYSES